MALNVAVFKTRTLTAVVFVIVMLTGLLWNEWSFFVLFSIIHFGCWVEYQKLVEKIDPGYKSITLLHKYGMMLSGWALMWFFFFDRFLFSGNALLKWIWAVPVIFILLISVVEAMLKNGAAARNVAHSMLGLLYISLSWGLFMDLYHTRFPVSPNFLAARQMDVAYEKFQFDHGWFLPVITISCMWINDTMAYIVGSFIGRTPFSKISPKKTWEGTLGGIILCVLVVGLILSSGWLRSFEPLLTEIKTYHWFIIAGIAAISGTAGDLFESKLKRMANVKDSGSFMPGHGGFLDRFDSLLVAAPLVWLYINVFMR